MCSLNVVRGHFDRDAERFDAIYDECKPLLQRVVDRLFRRVVVERFFLVRNLAPRRGDWSVLDVGCGSGRYVVALAHEGASRLVGVDVSEAMLRLARAEASRAGVGDRCSFHCTGFLEFEGNEKFDAVLAMGYFDYLEDPSAHLRKMASLCRGRIFASFPKRWEFRVPVRMLRFALRRSFVRFYGRGEVSALFQTAGIPNDRLSLIDMGRDWVVVARLF